MSDGTSSLSPRCGVLPATSRAFALIWLYVVPIYGPTCLFCLAYTFLTQVSFAPLPLQEWALLARASFLADGDRPHCAQPRPQTPARPNREYREPRPIFLRRPPHSSSSASGPPRYFIPAAFSSSPARGSRLARQILVRFNSPRDQAISSKSLSFPPMETGFLTAKFR